VSIWDGGWADQPEAEREGDWCIGDSEPWRGENAPPEEEFDDEAGDKWKLNHWHGRAGWSRVQDVQEAAERGGGVRNGNG
jgi:hypothetical protein